MLENLTPEEWTILGLVSIIELVLKGFALWKSAQAKHQWWFIAMLILNTFGILPVVYLLFFQKEPLVKKSKKK